MSALSITPDDMYGWNDEHWVLVREWVRANGLVPDDIPIAGGITIDQGYLAFSEFVRDEIGRMQVDGDHAITRARRVPLLKPFPELVPVADRNQP
jgi:hypothetical protein